ncbi:GDP-mannose 4,6-dehydratase [Candidatus Woesearchaeota archaeon]|nr:GDP-mannose 4,6-dehydratase [Candidatus Woesearchaeota archaeon]
MTKALVTGITGQDGSYLAELLPEKDYKVLGMHRRTSVPNFTNIEHLKNKITLVCGDLNDGHSLNEAVKEFQPDEVYNLAAQSDVKISEFQPNFTWETNAAGPVRLLEAIRKHAPKAKFYQASTSEMFGTALPPQNELTPFCPASPYGEAKRWAHEQLKSFRAQGIFAVGGILFNHESPRRGFNFVTRKITSNLAKIKLGFLDRFELGNLDAKRDWGFAGDYVEAMYLMLQQEKPEDYVVATGETHTVREFIETAGVALGMPITFKGIGADEKVLFNGREIITINPALFRRKEVEFLQGNASKAKEHLGWEPKTKFHELVELMAKSDLKLFSDKNFYIH